MRSSLDHIPFAKGVFVEHSATFMEEVGVVEEKIVEAEHSSRVWQLGPGWDLPDLLVVVVTHVQRPELLFLIIPHRVPPRLPSSLISCPFSLVAYQICPLGSSSFELRSSHQLLYDAR